MKPIEIFKIGKHTATNGQTLPFDETMLAAAVKGYDPKLHEAPVVVGHPKDNHPFISSRKPYFDDYPQPSRTNECFYR